MSDQGVPETYSNWAVGWTGFAAVMLIMIGVMDVIQGIVALANEDFFVVGEEWVLELNVTAWGWIHILVGIVLVLTGIGLLSGNTAARVVGVIVAAIVALLNFAWLPYYPVWSIIVIAICIAIIWALTAHGRDITYR